LTSPSDTDSPRNHDPAHLARRRWPHPPHTRLLDLWPRGRPPGSAPRISTGMDGVRPRPFTFPTGAAARPSISPCWWAAAGGTSCRSAWSGSNCQHRHGRGALEALHSQGGTGCASAHKPRPAARASASSVPSVTSLEYLRNHQAQPSLTSSRFRFRPSGHPRASPRRADGRCDPGRSRAR
jgi:hypothetical protein